MHKASRQHQSAQASRELPNNKSPTAMAEQFEATESEEKHRVLPCGII
jgi:hypothetical protein